MLNIKFTLNGGGGLARDIWHTTGSHRIHSQELLLLALLLVLLATGILNNLPGWTSCHCDNIRLVSWAENYVSYMTVQGIPSVCNKLANLGCFGYQMWTYTMGFRHSNTLEPFFNQQGALIRDHNCRSIARCC